MYNGGFKYNILIHMLVCLGTLFIPLGIIVVIYLLFFDKNENKK